MATHGYSRYTKGCRCEVCRAAKADYMRAKRNRARAYAIQLINETGRNFVPEIKHGIAGFQDHKCRCEVCTEAKAKARFRETRIQTRQAAADT